MNFKNMWRKSILEPKRAEEKFNYKNNEAKAQRILIDSIKCHLIPHVVALKTAKEVYDSLIGFYESNNTNRNLTLINNLCNVMMTRSDFVVSYLMILS